MLFGGVYLLWEDPLVLGCMGSVELSKALTVKRPATLLCFPTWLWTWQTIPALALAHVKVRLKGKQLHFMCNAVDEDRLLRTLGFQGALVSINAFINERTFRITDEAKQYDAVYSAQMQPFKRIHLAAKIPYLYVVTYGECRTTTGEYDLHRYEPAVAHAEFNRGWATYDEIASIHNRSRVGLALSACEGAMLAAVEYMLCGLPLVSTPCRGGRELFFDDRFVVVAEPNAEAVAAAVQELISRNVEPRMVREATLERIDKHRRALCDYIKKIVIVAGKGYRIPTNEEVYERIFGTEAGTMNCFVKFEEFCQLGLE